MNTVWKYEIPVADEFALSMPRNARVVHIAAQNNVGCLWALVDPEEESEDKHFRLAGTGHQIADPDKYQHRGSFMLFNGGFVGHVFEEVEWEIK